MAESDLSEKIVWVTGGSRGIGLAVAIAFAQRGARVAISSRKQKELEEATANVWDLRERLFPIKADVTLRSDVDDALILVKKRWGPVDILVNNAGVTIFKKVEEHTEKDWDALMNNNLKSAFLCCQAVLPDMKERKSGHIINVLSVSARQPYPNCSGYCASKYGLLGFTDVLRLEMRRHGIKVTAFFPGATDTAVWAGTKADRSRMMKTKDVAEALVAVVNSDAGSMIEEVVLRPIGGDL